MSSHSHSKDPQQPSMWKSMVNKLLGPDQSAPIKPIDDPLDMEGLDLDLLPPDPVKVPVPPARPSPPVVKPVTKGLDAVLFDDDEPDAEPESSVAKKLDDEPAEVFFSDEEDAVDEDLAPPTVTDKTEVPIDRKDSYWDALRDLDVAEDIGDSAPSKGGGRGGPRGGRGGRERSGGGGSRGGGSRGSSSRGGGSGGDRDRSDTRSRSDRSSRASEGERRRPASRSTPVSEELFADDDFGIGLIEEARAQVAASQVEEIDVDEGLDFAASGVSKEGDESSEPRKRRRRRGRRGRGRSRSEATASADMDTEESRTPSDSVPGDVLFDDTDDEAATPPPRRTRAESTPPPPRRAPVVDFDEPEDDEEVAAEAPASVPEEADEEPRRRRPRGGRGRGRSRDTPRSGAAEDVARRPRAATEAPQDPDDEDSDAAIERNKDKYRNVPTWEEAISYLVKPKRRAGGDSRGGRSRGSRGGPRSSRPRSRD